MYPVLSGISCGYYVINDSVTHLFLFEVLTAIKTPALVNKSLFEIIKAFLKQIIFCTSKFQSGLSFVYII